MASGRNRLAWNLQSDAYQAQHGRDLTQRPLAWGVWRVPESEVGALGDLRGRRVLELGCGAAQWTLALVRQGVHAVGVDLSDSQLTHARLAAHALCASAGLVQGDAEQLPFASASFDAVLSDHGAIVFARSEPTIAEIARVLTPGGVCALCMSTPLRDLCEDPESLAVTTRLAVSYFELSHFDDGQMVSYQKPYGAWIRLFRAHGLVVEDLVELRAPEHATTTYADFVPATWARQWPAEHIWKLRKVADGS